MDPTRDRHDGVGGDTAGGVVTAEPDGAESDGPHPDDSMSDDAVPGDAVPGRRLSAERDPAAIAAESAQAARLRREKGKKPPRPRVTLRELARSAFAPRMIGLLVLFLAAAVVCVQLSAWQLDRAALRGADEAIAEHAATLEAAPVPIEDVLPAQSSFSTDVYATGVSMTGEWEPDNQVLVVDREVEGEAAVLVVTALRLTEGSEAGAMIPVLRGWLPADQVEVGTDGATVADPAALDVPDGEVEVVGHLSNSEQHRAGATAPGTTRAISTAALAGTWGGPTFSGYLVEGAHDGTGWVTAEGPLRQAPDPTIAVETGLNLQNLAYAVEWLVFGGFALWLWWRIVRDDALDRRDEALLAAGTGTGRAA